jgi:hypothetical protein
MSYTSDKELDSYSFLSKIKNAYNEIKDELKYDLSIETWLIMDNIVYNEDFVNQVITTHKHKLNEEYKYKTRHDVIEKMHINHKFIDMTWKTKDI